MTSSLGLLSPPDRLGRPLRSLRLSVTDRCNLRCWYCMPEAEYRWMAQDDRLSVAELATLAGVFVGLGVDGIHVTGGEPLLRPELPEILSALLAIPGIQDVALTTNGVLLEAQAAALRATGLQRVTVSLDAMEDAAFARMSGTALVARVLRGVRAALDAGLAVKINCVVIRGRNDSALIDVLGFAREHGIEVRFIEYMDVGGATRWRMDDVVTRDQMLDQIARHHGTPISLARDAHATAERFALPDGTRFGIIASVTRPFCGDCDRARLTADGRWLLCLYDEVGHDLREPLRAGASERDLAQLIADGWRARQHRGAEERTGLPERSTWVSTDRLRRNPHLEMHTRGG